ncbi:DUF4271 domain-containing protein [Roseivirga sp. BDSF3-8]|uniref:DUF4271 domain-containing protein n=1 Tax=Roseivirga sp. BDSF3-8 TaxID=3241598 RepID=UPI00353180C8
MKRFWVTFDEAYESYRPYFTGSEAAKTSVSFYLDANRYRPYSLNLQLPPKTYIFINNTLAGRFSQGGNHYLSIDSLANKYHSDSLFITIFNENRVADLAETQITRQSLLASLGLSEDKSFLNLQDRQQNYFKEVFITLSIGWLILLAIGYNAYDKSYREFFSVARAFAFRLREENVLKNRPFTRENVMFFVIYCYLFSLIFFSVKHYFRPQAALFNFITFGSYSESLFAFTLFNVGLFFLLLIKYLLLINMGAIFDLRNLVIVHFIDYIRISLILFSFVYALLVIIFLSDIYIGLTITHIVYLLIASAFLRVVLVFFKLSSNSGFKFVHLFSYLCTTEIAPLVVALKFLLK